eukprot:scaffold12029_cov59-Attheya_sp.AAC.1
MLALLSYILGFICYGSLKPSSNNPASIGSSSRQHRLTKNAYFAGTAAGIHSRVVHSLGDVAVRVDLRSVVASLALSTTEKSLSSISRHSNTYA